MTDLRYILILITIATLMIVTVGHVAHYAGSFESGAWSILGWPYALAVEAAIVICAWLTRWKTTERAAWIGFVTFLFVSGAMNAAAIEPWKYPGIEAIFAWIYAIFPTLGIGMLGFLARQAEALSEVSKQRGPFAVLSRLWSQPEQKPKPTKAKAKPTKPETSGFVCEYPGCEKTFKTKNARNAHQRAHKNGREQINEQTMRVS